MSSAEQRDGAMQQRRQELAAERARRRAEVDGVMPILSPAAAMPPKPAAAPAPPPPKLMPWEEPGKWATVAAIWGVMALVSVLVWCALDLPDIRHGAALARHPSVTLQAADGSVFARFGDLHGNTIAVRDLPPDLVHAVISIEDRRFYHHYGVDPIGLMRALFVDVAHGRVVEGGSTLTQQLAKNLFLTPQRTMKRKIQEAMLALWLERLYTKDEILSAYLNRVYLGSGTYGVAAAADIYFSKPVSALSLAECALLAGLLKAPSRLDPVNNPAEAQDRAGVVLEAMAEEGYITQDEGAAARRAPAMKRRSPEGAIARYYADWVFDQISGYAGSSRGDLVVHTTLDPRVQRIAESRLSEVLDKEGDAVRAGEGAAVVLAPDGAVRAMVGGRDYQASKFNRITQAMRQPGSSFKPLVYLAALEAGMTPNSLVDDAPIRIKDWAPENFEPGYKGPIPMREALAESINTAAVRVLERAGINRVRALAKRLGITSTLGHDYSLALGTSVVTPLELTSAYAGIAAGGTAVWPYAITEIRDRNGNLIYHRHPDPAESVADAHAVADLVQMMTGVLDYGTGKSAKLNRPAAGKTGTSSDFRDAWFVGFSADYVAGVWVGNDDNSTMKHVTGGSLPAKIWHNIMMDASASLPARALPALNPAAAGLPAPTAIDASADATAAPAPASYTRPSASTGPSDDDLTSLIQKVTGKAR